MHSITLKWPGVLPRGVTNTDSEDKSLLLEMTFYFWYLQLFCASAFLTLRWVEMLCAHTVHCRWRCRVHRPTCIERAWRGPHACCAWVAVHTCRFPLLEPGREAFLGSGPTVSFVFSGNGVCARRSLAFNWRSLSCVFSLLPWHSVVSVLWWGLAGQRDGRSRLTARCPQRKVLCLPAVRHRMKTGRTVASGLRSNAWECVRQCEKEKGEIWLLKTCKRILETLRLLISNLALGTN